MDKELDGLVKMELFSDNQSEEKKPYTKLAKGKKLFTTQLPLDLIEELKSFSEQIDLPMTVLIEKYIQYGLAKSKRDGTIPILMDKEN